MRKLSSVPVKPCSSEPGSPSLTLPSLHSKKSTRLRNRVPIKCVQWTPKLFATKRRLIVYRHVIFFALLCIAALVILWTLLSRFVIMYEKPMTLQSMRDVLPISVHDVPDTLARYAQWHRVQRACIIDPSSCQQPFKSPPVLVWRCPGRKVRICAGIGDRVRGMQVAFIIAVITRRLFFIQWPTEEFPLSHAVIPNVIDWRVPPTIAREASSWPMLNWFMCSHPQRRNGCQPPSYILPKEEFLPNINLSLPTMNAFTDDIVGNLSVATDIILACRLRVSAIVAFLNNNFIAPTVPDLQDHLLPSLQLQRLLTTILFRPSAATAAVMSRTLTPGFSNPRGYIGAHARTGVAFGEPEKRFNFYRRNMTAAVTHLLTCVQHVNKYPPTSVFLASDSVTFKREFAAQAKSLAVEVRFIDATAFHFGLHQSHKLLRREGRRARYNAFIDIFADLFMLAGARQIVTTGSGFADLSFWLGNASQLIIAPSGRGTAICSAARDSPSAGNPFKPVVLKE